MDNSYSKWSQKRLKRIGVINRFIDGSITRAKAAELADITERQVSRIAKEVKDLGDGAYLHKNIGNSNAATVDAEMKEAIIQIYSKAEYKDVNFLHFCDSLAERHGILIPYATLESILKSEGKESPKKRRPTKVHRRRKRKKHAGELLQIDASPFDWFRNGEMYSLHGVIDDATGNPCGLYMCKNECRLGYFESMRYCVLNPGVPLSLYSDNHTIFRSPKTDKLTTEELLQGKEVPLTQFGRAMDELGVNIIYAKSPQAKGRVERMWETLQSRLPVEFALDGIKTVEAANKYLHDKVIPSYIEKWGVEAEGAPIFISLQKNVDIDTILCVKENRSTDNAGAFSINKRAFQVINRGFPLIPKGRKIEVLIGTRIGIKVRYQEQVYDTVRYLKPDRKPHHQKKPSVKAIETALPHLLHSSDTWKEIWHAESFSISLEFLYDLFLSDADIFKNKNKKRRKDYENAI